jgi:hypothetical protein
MRKRTLYDAMGVFDRWPTVVVQLLRRIEWERWWHDYERLTDELERYAFREVDSDG